MYSKVTEEPEKEPITLVLAKQHLRVDDDNEDELISLLIQVSREMAEKETNRSFITQERVVKLDYFPRCGEIKIPFGPVSEVSEITYFDEAEVEQTLDPSLYYVDLDSDIPRVVIKDYWPATFDKPNAVSITYTAGYGDNENVPGPIKSAMLLILGHLYENREQVITSNSGGIGAIVIPYGASVLLSQYVLEQTITYQ